MRAILSLLIVAYLTQQTSLDFAVLEGRLLHQGSSAPIASASIALARLNPNMPETSEAINLAQSVAVLMRSPLATSPGFIDGFLVPNAEVVGVSPDLLKPVSQTTVKTEESGRFTFKDLPPGKYALTAEAPGYFAPRFVDNSGATLFRVLTIEPRQKPPALELFMMRAGFIRGRILGLDGQPARAVGVVGYQSIYNRGRPSWNPEARTLTDDRGVFELGPLAPGEWFVGATSIPGPVRGALPPGVAPTFFPGVVDPAQASPVIVPDDLSYDGIDFTLRPFTTPTYKVSGTIINKVTEPTNSTTRSSVSLYLIPENPSLTDNPDLSAIPALTAAEFEIPNVKPGIYTLYAASRDILARKASTARTSIAVRDTDVGGIVLTIADGGTLQAEIFIDGNTTQDTRRERFSLRLRSADSMPDALAVGLGTFRFNAEGKLIASNVPIAQYSLEVLGLPQGAYVSDIRQSGQSVYNDGVLIEAKQNSVQITVRLDGATISGVVQAPDRKPASTANVILAPPVTRRGNPIAYKTAMTDDAGRFSFAGVMPGTYTIFALKSRPYRQPWLNPAFISRYEDRARVVRVETRGTAEIQLALITD